MTSLATLFDRSDAGNAQASHQLFAALYDELRQVAERQLRRSDGRLTLGATTLLHETYLAISEREAAAFPDRARFIEVAETELMSLREGYYARYQVRPSEFRAWQSIWEKG